MTSSAVYLRDGSSNQLVQAELHDVILQRHLDDHSNKWKPLISNHGEQHGHWDWAQKCSAYSGQLSYQTFALECNGQTQGLMIVTRSSGVAFRSKLTSTSCTSSIWRLHLGIEGAFQTSIGSREWGLS